MSGRISTQLRRAPTKYRPTSRIAAGGMAEVWRAEAAFEDGTTYPVAIKRVLPELRDDLMRGMFRDEARLGMMLRHPNIVRVYDARDVGQAFIMVMELVDGDSLKGLLDRAHARQACMPVPTALYIALQLARALHYVHHATDYAGKSLGIIHRDVSPHNLLLGLDGVVKLTDFGLADATTHQTLRDQELVGGKLGYLAPEIVAQEKTDHRIDLYGLGIILWEMLAGRRLYQRANDRDTVRAVLKAEVPSLREINPAVSKEVDVCVAAMLARDPNARYKSARQLGRALEILLHRTGQTVGGADIELLVKMHLAMKGRDPKPAQPSVAPMAPASTAVVAGLLAGELDLYAEETRDSHTEIGSLALDPDEFEFS